MTDESQRRLARNEALFRETNEAIEAGQWPNDPDKTVRFRCECSRMDCNQALEITLGEYERVRQSPRRFVIADGHDQPEIESVVERRAGYVVVEKQDAAGAAAASSDPRQ